MQNLKAIHHIVASSAETMGAFDTGFDRVNLHRLTMRADSPRDPTSSSLHDMYGPSVAPARQGLTLVHFSAQLERFVWDKGCA